LGQEFFIYTREMSEDSKFHVKRQSDREVFDREAVNSLLDSQYVAHVGFVDPDVNLPFVIPMGFARDNDRILLHGSTGSRMMMAIAKGIDICVTVTQLNGIVVARSAFNSSMNYESVMIFGRARVLAAGEQDLALEEITEKLVPGLWGYCRPMTAKEAAATMIVELPIERFSAKARSGDPIDEDSDLDLPIWAGILPILTQVGQAQSAANAAHLPIPSHISTR
jgi:nitroimidazol reductase NimA-like FMN-containing flavoprotein (pyridoxamine 5'-phosphate oxidase superfamily)